MRARRMTMRAARFSQADINRAVLAVKKACGSAIVEIAPDGTIRIAPVELSPQPTDAPSAQPLAPERDFRL